MRGDSRGAAVRVVGRIQFHQIEAAHARVGAARAHPSLGLADGPAAGIERTDAGGVGGVEHIEIETGEKIFPLGQGNFGPVEVGSAAVGAEPVEVLANSPAAGIRAGAAR